jgi:hypothetical protein
MLCKTAARLSRNEKKNVFPHVIERKIKGGIELTGRQGKSIES